MDTKTCYIASFWLGDRRKMMEGYIKDRLYFLKHQITSLETYSHNLSQIIFNFNITPDQYHHTSDIFALVPKLIGSTPVKINFRENKGISYGAFSDLFGQYKNEYDYFIFNEDDYVFTEHNWDQYLVTKYNSYPDCGYLCALVREPAHWFNYRKFAGVSIGIASSENLSKVYSYSGNKLPYPDDTPFKNDIGEKAYLHYEDGQMDFTFNFLQVGLNIYDIRDDYKVIAEAPNLGGDDVCIYFHNKEKTLLTPIRIINSNYRYFEVYDREFDSDYGLTIEEALDCYNNKIRYDELKP